MAISLLLSMTANAAKKTKIAKSDFVTVKVENPTANGAKWVRLQVMNDNIIRVEATPEDDFPSKTSLIIVPQNAKPVFSVKDENGKVTVEAKKVKAVVDKKTGEVRYGIQTIKGITADYGNGIGNGSGWDIIYVTYVETSMGYGRTPISMYYTDYTNQYGGISYTNDPFMKSRGLHEVGLYAVLLSEPE